VRVSVVLLVSFVIDISVFGLGSMLLAVFLSLVMRLRCLVSDFVMGGCSFVAVSLVACHRESLEDGLNRGKGRRLSCDVFNCKIMVLVR
jgi:hypothetical protein